MESAFRRGAVLPAMRAAILLGLLASGLLGCRREVCEGTGTRLLIKVRFPGVNPATVGSLWVRVTSMEGASLKEHTFERKLYTEAFLDGETSVVLMLEGAGGSERAIVEVVLLDSKQRPIASGAQQVDLQLDACLEVLVEAPPVSSLDAGVIDAPLAPDLPHVDGPVGDGKKPLDAKPLDAKPLDVVPACKAFAVDGGGPGKKCPARAGYRNLWPSSTDADPKHCPAPLTGVGATEYFKSDGCNYRKDYTLHPGCGEILVHSWLDCGGCPLDHIHYEPSAEIGGKWQTLGPQVEKWKSGFCWTICLNTPEVDERTYKIPAGATAVRVQSIWAAGFHVCLYER